MLVLNNILWCIPRECSNWKLAVDNLGFYLCCDSPGLFSVITHLQNRTKTLIVALQQGFFPCVERNTEYQNLIFYVSSVVVKLKKIHSWFSERELRFHAMYCK
jgi:hypothetical protein